MTVQLPGGVKPVFVRRSIGAASGYPQAVRQNGDVLVRGAGLVRLLVRFLGVLKGLPGALVARLMIPHFVGFSSDEMGVCGAVMQFRSPLMPLVA